MSLKSKIKTFFFLEEENEEEILEEVEPIKKQPIQKNNVVSLQSVQKSSKMIIFEPKVYEDAQNIADQIKSRRAVVVNLQSIEKEQAKKIIDFLSGTVYALGGEIQKIGIDIFLCTPDNVEVSGNISHFIQE